MTVKLIFIHLYVVGWRYLRKTNSVSSSVFKVAFASKIPSNNPLIGAFYEKMANWHFVWLSVLTNSTVEQRSSLLPLEWVPLPYCQKSNIASSDGFRSIAICLFESFRSDCNSAIPIALYGETSSTSGPHFKSWLEYIAVFHWIVFAFDRVDVNLRATLLRFLPPPDDFPPSFLGVSSIVDYENW